MTLRQGLLSVATFNVAAVVGIAWAIGLGANEHTWQWPLTTHAIIGGLTAILGVVLEK